MQTEIDLLRAYLPIDRVHALARGKDLPTRTSGAALFADISGFTPLTERLARQFGPRRGAEELTRHLNRVYETLIAEIHRHGGSVIGFAGDAMTCWFDEKAAPMGTSFRAATCALAMQNVMQSLSQVDAEVEVSPPSRNPINLTMKVAVATGPARRFVVGDPAIQLLDVMAGTTFARMAAAEHLAGRGEVIGDAPTIAALEGRVEVLEWRADPETSERFAVIKTLTAHQSPITDHQSPITAHFSLLTPEQLRPWLLPVIYERLRSGQGEFLTELRLAVALFLRFEGIDYDGDEAAGEKLNAFIRRVQSVLAKYEGVLLHLTMGDKGSYLNAAFGAPISHEDDTRRAVSAALELRALPQSLPQEFGFIRPLQMGITRGGMRAGAYGSQTRRIYDVMGDDVNLAARLMQAAALGEVLASEAVRHAATEAFAWESLPLLRVKGKTEPITVYRLVGHAARQNIQSLTGSGNMIGRSAEREQLAVRLAALTRGQGGVCIIEGEAGIGKSRLVADLLEGAARADEYIRARVRHLLGAGDAIEKSTPYHAWRTIFAQLFEWDALSTDPDARRAHLLAQLPPGMEERAPLLNVVLPLDWPDNALTAQMTGEVRADNTRELLNTLLQVAAQRPTLLVLEDIHWLDSASWALVLAVQRIPSLLLVLATRPPSQPWPDEYARLRAQPGHLWLTLGALPSEDILALVCQRLGVATLPDPVAALIREKAEGHPFFSEELAYALRDSGVITLENGECRIAPNVDFTTVTVPDTVEGVITSRIDRLAPPQQLTLKVASVIGRVFTLRLLREVYPVEADKPHLPDHLSALQRLDLTPQDAPDPDLTYIFKHIITREVAYNLMTFAQRRELHRAVGQWYEAIYAPDLTPYYPILAHHWSKTDDRAKAIVYLEKAGDQAVAQYANQEAVSFLSEASRLAEEVQPPIVALRRTRWERQVSEACLKLGRHAESRAHSEKALMLLNLSLPAGRGKRVMQLLGQVLREGWRRLIPAGGRARSSSTEEDAGARLEAARAYFILGELAYYENDVVLGLALMLGIVDLLEGDEPSPELVNAYAGLSVVGAHLGQAGLTEMYSRLAQGTSRQLGRLETEAFVLQVKAIARFRLQRWAEAEEPASQAAAIFARLGDRRRWEECLNYLADIAWMKGEFPHWLELILEIVNSARQRNDANISLYALGDLATVRLVLGQTGEALDVIQTGFSLLSQSSDPKFEMFLCARLVQVHLRQGELQQAEQALERGKRLTGEASSTLVSAAASGALALAAVELWEARGQLGSERQAMAQFVRESLTNAREDWRPVAQPLLWRLRGWEAWLSGKPARARRVWRKSLAVAERLKIPYEAGLAHFVLGQHSPAGKERRAHLQNAIEVFERLGAVYNLEQARRLEKP